ncbi:SDR family oxidoreductase [Kitasatospora sp. NPDC059673]|uniref:SDR family oxidoreductase n=1 Tax=Kitasatospora sp. NPDC059673 TaxID=3346901 RepID=UPI00368F48F8
MTTSEPRTVVITGASAGIGRAAARAFAARGDRVALLARGRAGLDAALAEAREAGVRAVAITVDLADPEAVERAAESVERSLGPIDIWVNAALASVFAPFMEISPADFRRVTEVSYLGYVYATRAALRRMLPRDRGSVVQVGSAIAYRGIPLQSAYSGAKHALQGWHEALRCELLHQGTAVRCTMVQLPAVNTPQFDWVRSRLPRRARPVAPVYQPEPIARAILYAADHPGRREYRVGASTVATLLANAVAPGLLDRYLARTGFDAQQTEQDSPPGAPDNLWTPQDAVTDHGAHGRFDDEAHAHTPQAWADRHRAPLAAAALLTSVVLGTGLRRRRG